MASPKLEEVRDYVGGLIEKHGGVGRPFAALWREIEGAIMHKLDNDDDALREVVRSFVIGKFFYERKVQLGDEGTRHSPRM